MEDLPVNLVDVAFVAVVLVSGLLALYRGFVTEVLAVAGWVGAAIVTLTLFEPARPIARDYIPSELAADVATGIALFVISLIVISTVTHFAAKLVRGKRAGVFDRALGFLFGLLRGYVVLALLFLLFSRVYPPTERPAWMSDALTLPALKYGSDTLLRLVPAGTLEQGGRTGPRDDGTLTGLAAGQPQMVADNASPGRYNGGAMPQRSTFSQPLS